jgi:uncharacterized membrane protein
MTIRSVILWVHVLCGVVWVGACATFILAAGASAQEPKDSYTLAIRIVPQINRFSVPLAFAIPITGIGNLFFAAQERGAGLPVEFVGIVAAKVVLLALMTLALGAAWRAVHSLMRLAPMGEALSIRRIIASYGVIVGAGILALALGLWLSGA